MYRLSHRNIGLLICCYRGSLILGIMHVYLTAHMREGISARPGVTGGVTGSGGTSNTQGLRGNMRGGQNGYGEVVGGLLVRHLSGRAK